jgi:R3H domain
MHERQRWVVHESVADTVDMLLRGRQPNPQTRSVGEDGKVAVSRHLTAVNGGNGGTMGQLTNVEEAFAPARPGNGWRTSGKMVPLQPVPSRGNGHGNGTSGKSEFDRLLDESWGLDDFDFDLSPRQAGPNGEDLPLHVYPYGVSRSQLEQVVSVLNLPIAFTKDLDSADSILALRSHVKNHAKLRQLAKSRHLPLHMIKSSTIPQITRGLRRMLNMDDPEFGDERELQLMLHNGTDDEVDALEEARLAVEQIVIPKGQPVELLPRSAQVRKIQHELVEHYRLKSDSFGEEPNRRLRIYPA